jgi:ribonucleoside-diphosphate reductase alpha chain
MSTLTINRVFSNATINPYDDIPWNKRTVVISDDKGAPLFEQKDVEAPAFWTDMAVKIVASKYFYGQHGTPERENSVRDLVHRVARTISNWGTESGYFSSDDGEIFYEELSALCLNQYGVFNSPVWFNVGLWHEYKAGANGTSGGWAYNYETGQVEKQTLPYLRPQGSACFIQSVEDNMDSIMALATSEAMLFKFGSGTGTDLTTIRSSKERLSGGGKPSGPMSFLKVYDQVANTVKSGGKTRRAAKMNTLRDWHPDIEEFITAKMKEEKKAHALIDAGYDGSFNGEAYGSVMYQNENLSVRVSDEFMNAAIKGEKWPTRSVTKGEVIEEKDASKLLDQIAEGTWFCGDPGLQYDGAIQRWHTCKGTEPIHSTNPCSEYIFLNNTACNLASLNLLKFRTADGQFDIEKFKAAARIFIIAQEILVDSASYPTKLIAENSHIFRTLGLGYANLGSLIMSYGLPYDSKEGNTIAGSLAALMTGVAYKTSAEIASVKGPFAGYEDARCSNISKPLKASNKESMLEVIRAHVSAANTKLDTTVRLPGNLNSVIGEAQEAWNSAYEEGLKHGYRNAQVTVVAPTGTIAFMMDCDTTGIEPDIGLVKYKTLAGGGMLKIVNTTVPLALKQLGYSEVDVARISDYIFKHDTIEDVEGETSGLKPEHLPIFDCAFKAAKGKRSIAWVAHLNVMAQVQPFISGAISKTVNMPANATVADIRNAYIEAWQLGLKCVAIYRDGSKRSQPLNMAANADTSDPSALKALEAKVAQLEAELRQVTNKPGGPYRERLEDTREAVTHKFNVGGQEGYVTVGLYDDGRPGELFVQMSKEGSTMGGLMDTIGTLTSIALQYGVPLETLIEKFSHQRFEPHGYTSNPKIRSASSIIDYIFRWMGSEFKGNREEKTFDVGSGNAAKPALALASTEVNTGPVKLQPVSHYKSGQCCPVCGSSNVQISGTCATCTNCGTSLGCS